MARARTTPLAAPRRRGDVFSIGVVLLLGVLAYANSLRGDFVFDDLGQIVGNPAVRSLGTSLHPWSGQVPPNRYVGYVTFALNHSLGGFDPFGWHLANLLIHLANAILVWAFVRLAFCSPRLRISALAPASGVIAFASAGLFVAHPIATQAVSYVVQRLTSLATFFFLAAVVLYVAWRMALHRWGRVALYVGVLLASLLALRTKEIAFTLPFALVLVEWAFFEGDRRRFLPVVPVAALAVLVPLSLIELGSSTSATLGVLDSAVRAQSAIPRVDYLRTQAVVVARYLGLLVFPVGQSLDHDITIRTSWVALDVMGGVLLLASLAALGAWLACRSNPRGKGSVLDPSVRLVALGIFWFFLTLSVESSLIPIADVMNEHRVYLPSAGFFPAVATLIALLFRRLDPTHLARNTAVLAGIAASALAVATWNRNHVWRSEVALWTDAAQKSPGHRRPLRKLGAALTQEKRYVEAATVFRRIADLEPGSAAARVQLGVVLYWAGRAAEASVELRRAVQLDPNDPEALFNLSFFLVSTGMLLEARPFLERVVQEDKDRSRRAWARSELAR